MQFILLRVACREEVDMVDGPARIELFKRAEVPVNLTSVDTHDSLVTSQNLGYARRIYEICVSVHGEEGVFGLTVRRVHADERQMARAHILVLKRPIFRQADGPGSARDRTAPEFAQLGVRGCCRRIWDVDATVTHR